MKKSPVSMLQGLPKLVPVRITIGGKLVGRLYVSPEMAEDIKNGASLVLEPELPGMEGENDV